MTDTSTPEIRKLFSGARALEPTEAEVARVMQLVARSLAQRRVGRRRRLIVAGVGLVCVALGTAVYAAGSTTTGRPGGAAHPLGFDPITLEFARSGSIITSIAVTVQAPLPNATVQVQVLRGSPYSASSAPGRDPQIVFEEQLPMKNVASPAQRPPGAVALSTWSGSLSPGDWDGGCQDASYTVAATVVPTGSSFGDPPNGSLETEAPWFTCGSGQ